MKNIAMLIEYDGTRYSGWQIQPNQITIQGTIETSLYKLTGIKIGIIGAGRTDAGVHARGQTANFSAADDFPIPIEKLIIALNAILPKDICITKAREMPAEFHSRFSAVAREYSYSLSLRQSVFSRLYASYFKYPFSEDLLFQSAELFVGEHDYSAFSKYNPDTHNYKCTVEESRWEKRSDGLFIFHIKANRFVYGMVRSIVGTMLDLAQKKRTFEDVKEKLVRPNRLIISRIAPPEGLVLEKIYYPLEFENLLR